MTIKLLAIGKTDSKQLESLIDTYKKRLVHYIRFEIELLPDLKKTKHLTTEQQKFKEGELLLKKINATDVVVLLDEKGKQISSIGFSKMTQKWLNSGIKQLVFIIGGPYGFSNDVYTRANSLLSLSKMTFSHQMVRLFFIEQVYRSFTIIKNEPYHHQ